MSWLDRLTAELTARGVTGRDRDRIILELRDHIACEPESEARLGDARELGVSFADELATARARSSALHGFGALAIAAVALIVSQLAIGDAGGYPGFDNGLSVLLSIPALLGMFIAPQVALVAGTLAALRAVRRRRAGRIPAAEIDLIRRRAGVGLGAGFATAAGLELYVLNFSSVLPAWWLVLVGGLAGAGGIALLAASVSLARAGRLTSGTSGRAGDVYDDLPVMGWSWLRLHPWRLGVIASVSVGLVVTLFEAHAERSLIEGFQRGVFEGLAAAAGFALLGRIIGVASPGLRTGEHRPRSAARSGKLGVGPALAARASDQLVADDDKALAELLLRESFGHGRLSLDQLTARRAQRRDRRQPRRARHGPNGVARQTCWRRPLCSGRIGSERSIASRQQGHAHRRQSTAHSGV